MDSQAAYPGCWGVAVALACVCCAAYGQTAQKGADVSRRTKEKLRVDYIGYRAARYETEAVVEPQNGRPNRGGFIRVYLTNTSGKDLQLAYYRCNGKDVSHWLLNGYFAWDRLYNQHLNPGQTTVLEINAVTGDFGAGQPFSFAYIDRSWLPACFREAILAEDPVQISLVRMLPGLRELEVHVRHTGGRRVVLGAVQVLGRNTEHLVWAGATHSVALKGPSYAIARIRLDHPLAAADLAVLRLSVEEDGDVRQIYAHRRAFEDWFPIGCWSAEPDTYGPLRRHHIELVVRGGRADHEFYSDIAPKYGFRTMCPTGAFDGLDTIRSLADHPAVACWMLADEPDWSTPPVVMMHSDAFARRNNRTKPTFITLCRNVKFFEYGPIADIPCMDHYCVTAPTSSKWPEPYGTRLEETAYYTRDLKTACEPKPIWVWSQAIASWDERPRRPVPTPDELAAQLLFNLGRGAKGILWFNYEHEVAERFPDARDAMRRWGRVLRTIRPDLLAAEPVDLHPQAPDDVDVAALASWDKLVLIVINLDYEIHPESYPFRPKSDVRITVDGLPWLRPAAGMLVAPDGVEPISFDVNPKRVEVSVGPLEVGKLIVLSPDPDALQAYQAAHARAVEDEDRPY